MNKRLKIVCAALSFALLVAGLLSPNLLSTISSGRVSAQSQQSGKQTEELSAMRLAVREMTRSLVEVNERYHLASKAERKRLLNDLREAVASRKQLLAELMESDPGEVLRVALPASLRESLPSAIRNEVEQHVDVEGELEVLYECWEDWSRLHHFLNTDSDRLSLHFAGDPPTDLLTGSRVRLNGVRVGQQVALESRSDAIQSSTRTGVETMMAVAPNTFGEQKVLVLLVNFQDKQTQPWTPDQFRNLVLTTVNNFYKESSYQQTWLTGDVFGWYTLPISSANCDQTTIATYAKQAATAAGVNLSAYNRYVYAFPSLSCGWTGWGTYGGNPSQAWINGSMSLRTVAHELGHNFGLYHARAMGCHPGVIGTGCSTIEYGDTLDILGKSGVTGHSHAHQKERAGWLGYGSSPGLTTVESSGTYWLDPYETVGTNPKALKILKSVDSTGRKTWYYVEFRRPVGFDSFISGNNNLMNGVMIHTGTDSYSFDLYLLDMTPETTSWTDAALVVGRSYNDPNINVTISPLSVSNSGAAVSVSFGAQPCVHANPTATLSPSATQWVAAGSSVTYQLSLTNNDGTPCASSNFNLQASVPSGWTAVFNSPSLNANSGGSATTTLTVTSPSTAANGFYNLSVTAANSGDPSYSSTATVTCAVASSLGVAVSSNQSSYTRTQTATVTSVVTSGGSPVSGASVTFTMTKADGSTATGTATTAANGSAVYSYRFNKRQDPVGTYQVTAAATRNGISGNGTTTFTVR